MTKTLATKSKQPNPKFQESPSSSKQYPTNKNNTKKEKPRNNNKKTPPKNRTKRKHSEESKPIKQIKLMTTKYLEWNGIIWDMFFVGINPGVTLYRRNVPSVHIRHVHSRRATKILERSWENQLGCFIKPRIWQVSKIKHVTILVNILLKSSQLTPFLPFLPFRGCCIMYRRFWMNMMNLEYCTV